MFITCIPSFLKLVACWIWYKTSLTAELWGISCKILNIRVRHRYFMSYVLRTLPLLPALTKLVYLCEQEVSHVMQSPEITWPNLNACLKPNPWRLFQKRCQPSTIYPVFIYEIVYWGRTGFSVNYLFFLAHPYKRCV